MMRNLLVLLALMALVLPTALAIDTPVIESSTHPDQLSWYKECSAIFKWSHPENSTWFSYKIDQMGNTEPPEEYAEKTALDTNYLRAQCKQNGTWQFHVRACGSTGCSQTAHYTYKIDKTAPRAPQKITAEPQEDGSIVVTWEPSIDQGSQTAGIKGYNIYRGMTMDFEPNDSSLVSIEQPETTYHDIGEFLDWGLEEGRTYFYKISAIDNAGNVGNLSVLSFAETVSKCSLALNSSIPAATNESTLGIEISDANGLTMYRSKIDVTKTGGEPETFVEQDNRTSIATTYEFESEGTYKFRLYAVDDVVGDACDTEYLVIYDTTPPTISITSHNGKAIVTGEIELSAVASDDGGGFSGIESVVFNYAKENGSFGSIPAEKSGDTYTASWDTIHVDNGRYTITATVTDRAGNTATDETTVIIKNMGNTIQETRNLIDAAREKQKSAQDKEKILAAANVYTDEFYNRVEWADGNLALAKKELDIADYEISQRISEKAIGLYGEALDSISVADYKQEEYIYNKEQARTLFSSTGLATHLVDEATEMVNNHEITRSLKLTKVTEGELTYYVANIVVRFKNLDLNAFPITVVEVVPKEFSQNASAIRSSRDFNILREDPIIMFDVGTVSSGKEIELTYGTGKPLTEEDAEKILEDNIINKFASAPIVVNMTGGVSEGSFGFVLPNLGSLIPDFGADSTTTIGIVVVGILVAVIIILLVVVFMLVRGRGGIGKLFKKKGRQTTLEIFK